MFCWSHRISVVTSAVAVAGLIVVGFAVGKFLCGLIVPLFHYLKTERKSFASWFCNPQTEILICCVYICSENMTKT